MDIVKHLSKEKVLEFIGDNDRLRDFYNCGPVHQANVDMFVVNIIERSLDLMRQEIVSNEDFAMYNKDDKSFFEGNNTGVVDCMVAFRNQFLEFDE